MVRSCLRRSGNGPLTPEMIAILAVGATLAGMVWQSHRALRADLRADLSAGLREAKEDRERLRAEAKEDRERLRSELSARMDRIEGRMERMEARMDGIEARFDGIHAKFDGVHARFDGIHSVIREQGERLSRIEGMLHLHLGRNEDPAPLAPAE